MSDRRSCTDGATKEDGGPAFPVECYWENDKVRQGVQTGNTQGWATGMSLRDYFAAHAPGDLIHTPHESIAEGEATIGRPYPAEGVIEQGKWAMEVEAKVRYMYADAMLKAREA